MLRNKTAVGAARDMAQYYRCARYPVLDGGFNCSGRFILLCFGSLRDQIKDLARGPPIIIFRMGCSLRTCDRTVTADKQGDPPDTSGLTQPGVPCPAIQSVPIPPERFGPAGGVAASTTAPGPPGARAPLSWAAPAPEPAASDSDGWPQTSPPEGPGIAREAPRPPVGRAGGSCASPRTSSPAPA